MHLTKQHPSPTSFDCRRILLILFTLTMLSLGMTGCRKAGPTLPAQASVTAPLPTPDRSGAQKTTPAPLSTTPFLTSTPIPPTVIATPTRHSANTPTSTPSPQENAQPRWKQYDLALVKAFVPSGSGHCIWKILGKQEEEVYVWAYCISTTVYDRSRVSAPAVIRLSPNGEIEEVKIPREGIHWSDSIRKLFPPEVQVKIFDSHKPQPSELGTPLP